MHMTGKRLFPLLVGCAMAVALSACADSHLKVLSAERSRGYSLGTRTIYPEKTGDVFLKVSYRARSEDDLKKDLYITDGKTRYPVQYMGFTMGGAGGAGKRWFVVVTVPASQLEFQAVLGDYPPESFKVDKTIQDQL